MNFVSGLSSTYKGVPLVTMDPISNKECTPDHFVECINKKFYRGSCQNLPPDFSSAKIDAITDKGGDGNGPTITGGEIFIYDQIPCTIVATG